MSEDGSPTAFALTLNATDVDTAGAGLTWSIQTAASSGTATASGTGNSKAIGYTPNANYNGTDTFVVQVSDGVMTDTIIVNVTIEAANDAPVVTDIPNQTIAEGGTFATIVLDSYVSDADNSDAQMTWSYSGNIALTVNIVDRVATITAPSADWNGSETVTFRATDPGTLYDEDAANFAVTSVNIAPVVTEGASANVNMSVNGLPIAFDLTLHATDADISDTLTWSILTAAANGTATASGTGASMAIGYIPDTDYAGSDSFVVQVSDGIATDTITVNVTIEENYAPDITEDWGYAVTISINGTPNPFALTLHATDANADTLTWSILTAASHGTAAASGTGASKAIGYTPAADYFGLDSFIVQVSDGAQTDSILINVTVGETPDITEDWGYPVTMSEDGAPTPFDLTLHATDSDSATLTWSISSAASHGTATASGTGISKVIGYTPAANYNGTDTFIVQVSDGALTDTIRVDVTIESVNDLPVIAESDPQAVGMSENGIPTPFVLTLHATDADSPTLTWSILTAAAHGTATASGTGASKVIGYTPDTSYNGPDSFVVQVSDGTDTDTITVNVTIGAVSFAPVITESDPQAVGMSEDGAPTAFALTLHATDEDIEDTLTWSILVAAAHGTATASGTGASKAIGYTPAANYNGTDTFVVRVSDGTYSDTLTVNVAIGAVNDAPVMNAVGSKSVVELVTLNFTATGTDIDIPAQTLTFNLVGAPTGASITSGGAFSWKPTDAQGPGSYPFDVCVSDGSLNGCETITVTVIANTNAPTVVNDSYSTNEDTAKVVAAPGVLVNDSDTEGNALTAIKVSDPSHGSLTLNSDGSFTYTPFANYFGGDSFTYKANDGMLDSSIATVTIIVNGENDAPVCSAVTLTTTKNTQGQADPDCTDAENDTFNLLRGGGQPRRSLGGRRQADLSAGRRLCRPGQLHL